VLDVAPLQPGEVADVAWRDGRRSTATRWLDIVEAHDGEVLAGYASTPWPATRLCLSGGSAPGGRSILGRAWTMPR